MTAFDLLSSTARWAGESGEMTPVYDPRTGQVASQWHRSDAGSVDAAIVTAHVAWETSWRRETPAARARVLLRIAASIREHADELARLEAAEVGKPFSQARAFDLEFCIGSFEYFAGLLAREGGTGRFVGSAAFITELEPFGVVAGILPFNWPPIHTAAKVAPALAAGNAVVIKPPEQAPSAVIRLCEVIAAALPDPDLVQVLVGSPDVARAMIAHPLIGKVSFTGSPEAGRSVAALAAQSLTPCMLELGGKNALIVLPDADLDAAVAGAVEGAFFNQGEACTAASRLLVHADVKEAFVAGLAAAVSRLRVGDPFDARTHLGPLVSAAQRDRVLGYLETARAEGATVAAEAPLDLPEAFAGGYWVRPTLLDDVDPDSTIAREEVFGPVTGITVFDEPEQALRIANDTPFALVAAVYSQNHPRALNLAREIDAGIVFINNYNRTILGTPFGGNRASGYGREHAPETLLAFGRSKSYKMPSGRGEIPLWDAAAEVTGQ